MSVPSATTKQSAPSADAPLVTDPNRYKRFELALLGRFMRANKQEYPCKLNFISVGEALMPGWLESAAETPDAATKKESTPRKLIVTRIILVPSTIPLIAATLPEKSRGPLKCGSSN